MGQHFDDGYRRPYATLVRAAPGDDVYPPDSFRTEWGPIFHRGRLDGTARVLVLGQDPATHETICRRILVGEAGQRAQGFLARLGITRSYVLVNAFLYSVYGQGGGTRHVDDDAIAAYRHRWLDTLARHNRLEAIVTFGQLADVALQRWRRESTAAADIPSVALIHPTYPESASATGTITKADAMARLTASWNEGLTALAPVVTPDEPVVAVPYGATITDADLAAIPAGDLPAGLPAWMGALDSWAVRTGADPQMKRATITVTVPRVAPHMAGAAALTSTPRRHTRRPGAPVAMASRSVAAGTAMRSAGSPGAMRAGARPIARAACSVTAAQASAGTRWATRIISPAVSNGHPRPSGLNGSCTLSAPAATTAPASRSALTAVTPRGIAAWWLRPCR